ncbi:MAG: hypothetical protein P8X74_14950 [Reinekea sp.]
METLPNGSVVVQEFDGRFKRPVLQSDSAEPGVEWSYVRHDAMAAPAFGVFYRSLSLGSKALLTSTGLISTEKPFNLKALKSPPKVLTEMVKDIRQGFTDLRNFDYYPKQGRSMAQYRQEIEVQRGYLGEVARMLTNPETLSASVAQRLCLSIHETIGAGIHSRTGSALKGLESLLASGQLLGNVSELPNEGGGALAEILQIRKTFYGAEDELVNQLSRILQHEKASLIDRPPYSGRIAGMIADYAALSAVVLSLSRELSMQRRLSIVSHAQQLIQNSLANVVVRAGLDKTDPFGEAAKGFDAVQAIFRQKNDQIARLYKKHSVATGMQLKDKPAVSDTTVLFLDLINTMKTGDSISLTKGKTQGFSSLILRSIFDGVVAGLSGLLVGVMATPTFSTGVKKDLDFTVTKTADGISLKIEMFRIVSVWILKIEATVIQHMCLKVFYVVGAIFLN